MDSYFAKVNGVKEVGDNTQLLITTQENIYNKIINLNRDNRLNVELKLNDGRTITTEQRKKIYATIRDIADYIGDAPEYFKEFMKVNYCIERGEEYFSLSDCSITTAREFINYLIEFALSNDIPLQDLAINRTDDIDRYLYQCIKYRVCAITGKKNADIHHCTGSRVGMGRNRQTINHSELEIIALSREWHTKVHQQGEEEIFKKYGIYGIKVNRETLKLIGLNVSDIN